MMQAPKGRSETDGTYTYTCGKCDGTGQYHGQTCDWCCAGDFEAITAKLKSGVRGQQYYSLLKEHLRISGKAMVTEARRGWNGKLTPVDIGYLSLRYRLNFKATWEWLYECRVTHIEYEDIPRKFTVEKAYSAAREKHGQIVEWKSVNQDLRQE